MAPEVKHVIRLFPLLLLAVAAILLLFRVSEEPPTEKPRPGTPEGGGAYAGSLSCRECHAEIHDVWAASHHGRAERPFSPQTDGAAFRPEHRVEHGSIESILRERAGVCEILTVGAGGVRSTFRPLRVIGVDPLWQIVVAAPGGRYQVTQLAFDPRKREWFDIFGDEDRRPDEWGFWANRGMSWNSMCAVCHTTAFEKNYDVLADSYDTKYLELGVGCEACHGPSQAHIDAARAGEGYLPPPVAGLPDSATAPIGLESPPPAAARTLGLAPRLETFRVDPTLDACGSCHARQVQLTGEFRAGESYFDHFRPVIPDDTDIYYPDGQVRDENYEYVSFLSSRMYLEGVRCVHCHQPHSGKVRLQGNDLCLTCHKGKIDPAAHSRHDPQGPGGRCVDCHMPLTTYMQRHPRRDHGFTIPDPLLSVEFGIPNSCNRCHTDKDAAWALETTTAWYGEKMNRPSRRRARAVAQARRGDAGAVATLLAVADDDPSPLWRAVAAGLLGRWLATHPEVRSLLAGKLGDPDPLMRSTAARLLEPLADLHTEAMAKLLDDPARMVRIDAAWSLRRFSHLPRRAGRDLRKFLDFNADQPGGALQLGVYHLDRSRTDGAEPDRGEVEKGIAWLRKAIAWDPYSPPLRHTLATALDMLGRVPEAIAQLEEAVHQAPDEPVYAHGLALLAAEEGKIEEAARRLEAVCENHPDFAPAWYNLALARSQLEKPSEALIALEQAILLEPGNPEFLHTKGTLHLQLNEEVEAQDAFDAARRAVEGFTVR